MIRRFALLAGLIVAGAAATAQSQAVLEAQRAAYDAVQPKTIVALQPFRHDVSAPLPGTDQTVRLISLNPNVNTWFLLQIGAQDGTGTLASYHLENPDPAGRRIELETGENPALAISDGAGTFRCAPWIGKRSALIVARETGLPFAPFCQEKLYLRNQVTGSRTNLERTTDFLRDHVWGGERIVRFVKGNFFKDTEFKPSEELDAVGTGRLALGPGAAAMDVALEDRPVISTWTTLGMDGAVPSRMTMGLWYPIAGLPGVYTTAIQPRSISKAVLQGGGPVNALDSIEGRATDHMVAFDLGLFDVHFAVGTDHPGLEWSPRPPRSVRPEGMPGPDGVDDADPLVRLGMISPAVADRAIAVFAGGFKRQHGAFRRGDYITLNFGTHYGFIENGVILSKLQPHLSTLYVLTDGSVGMKTWTEADNTLLAQIRFARQNGVPLIERDPDTGQGVPGALVNQWGPGNWSGSDKAELRTLRGGACLRENAGRRYLIYGYFATATPSAMTRTFQAYGCDYAMLLDMNALEHTYLALYLHDPAGGVHVQHLMPGMALIEKKGAGGTVIPRFLGFVDNRDLFYLTLRKDAP